MKNPSVLAFERKLSCSDGLMFSGNWPDFANKGAWQPLKVATKGVRGTISNRQKDAVANDPTKLNSKIESPNLQLVDYVSLPAVHDTLKVEFSLRVLGDLHVPSACNEPEYQEKLKKVVSDYGNQFGFRELSCRYAWNLANGRLLWRNRLSAEELKVRVEIPNLESSPVILEFIGLNFSIQDFPKKWDDYENIKKLAAVIEKGLAGSASTFLKVEIFARIGNGQEVFPSQELNLEEKKDKSKYLYSVDEIAAFHSQKIGNALRTIDTWYDENPTYLPIAIEPFGSVTNRGKAFRQPTKKKDFYTLIDNWILKDKDISENEKHFVVANLIRGGVFGSSSLKEKQ